MSCWLLLYVIVCVKQTCCPENLGWPDPYPPPSLRHGRWVYWSPPLSPPLQKRARRVRCSMWKFPPKDSHEYIFFGVAPAANSCHCVQHVHLAGAALALTKYPCILRDTHNQFSKNFTFKETVTVDATCDELRWMWIRKNESRIRVQRVRQRKKFQDNLNITPRTRIRMHSMCTDPPLRVLHYLFK